MFLFLLVFSHWKTPLHCSGLHNFLEGLRCNDAKLECVEVCRLLLQNGADVNATDE
jgi:hypothetical protein